MSKNDYLIRLERKEDYPVVENLIREAFWNVYRPGCMEHYLITRLREHPDFVRELDFVMMHEILHVALQHCSRSGDFEPERFPDKKPSHLLNILNSCYSLYPDIVRRRLIQQINKHFIFHINTTLIISYFFKRKKA